MTGLNIDMIHVIGSRWLSRTAFDWPKPVSQNDFGHHCKHCYFQCACFKMACNLKMAVHRAKWSEILELGVPDSCNLYGIFDHLVLRSTLTLSVHLSQNGVYVQNGWLLSETDWNLGLRGIMCIWGIFGLLVFKVILDSLIALVSIWPVTQKQLSVEWNGT